MTTPVYCPVSVITSVLILQTMFHGLTPVTSSFGLRMMKKMGWNEGQPLGKSGVGHLVPLTMDVKMDRTGEKFLFIPYN